MLRLAAAATVLLCGLPAAPRCTCNLTKSAESARDLASEVFLGEVVARRDTIMQLAPWSPRRGAAQIVTLEVHSRWKGKPSKRVELWTPAIETQCGVTFAVGTEYLVFASIELARLHTNVCLRTRPRTEAGLDIQALGAPTTP